MFSTLLESQSKMPRRTAGSIASVLLHAGIVGALVAATANAAVRTAHDRLETRVIFQPTPPPAQTPPPAVSANTPRVYTNAAPALGTPSLSVVVDIPIGIPPVDLSRAPTNENDFGGGPRGSQNGISGGDRSLRSDADFYFEGQVEKPVMSLPGTAGPAFPDMLRAAGVEGQVLAEFVVDSMGRATMETFTVLKSDHALFTNAVKTSLARMRFLPAEVGGRRVPQLVQQTFQFMLNR
ncbi:energy transducer TonB [Gemmatimonas sp.]|uniref:energy transducer TonB n=1 Tax=Gemmatimonas sp. TaxID=1962908 RepID=UPI003DA23E6D